MPIEVKNPATGETLATLQPATAADVQTSLTRAREAFPGWAALPFRARAGYLKTIARLIRDDARMIELLVSESGKPRYEAEVFEVLYTLELTRFYTGRAGRRALADDVLRAGLLINKRARVIHQPRGVVGVIGPWNWPLLNNFADAIAPLLAGNTVLLKPSEFTPLTSLRIAELWQEAGLPSNVFQVVVGAGDVGRELVAT